MNRFNAVLIFALTAVVTVTAPIPLLAQGARQNQEPDSSDWTPLMLAARAGDLPRMLVLLDGGADINAQSPGDRFTALIVATLYERETCVDALLFNKANPNLRDKHGFTALMYAGALGNTKLTEYLLQRKANVRLTNEAGGNALTVAAAGGSAEVVRMLLEGGADVNFKDPDGGTALMFAAMKGNKEIIKALIAAGADPSLRLSDGKTAADVARKFKHPEVIPLLVGRTSDQPSTPPVATVPFASEREPEAVPNVRFETAPVPQGWITQVWKGLNAQVSLPGNPEVSSSAVQLREGPKQESLIRLVHSNGTAWDSTYLVKRAFYPPSFIRVDDDTFFARVLQDEMIAGTHRQLEPAKHIEYGALAGRSVGYETQANGFAYETRLELFRVINVAYVAAVITPRGSSDPALARGFFRNVKLFDGETVAVGGPLLASEPPVAEVPDTRAESAAIPGGWITYSPKGFNARIALPGNPREIRHRSILPGGVKDSCLVVLTQGNDTFSVIRVTLPEDTAALDDDAFLAKAVEYQLFPGLHRLVGPAKRIAYGPLPGRAAHWSSQRYALATETQVDMFRDGRTAYFFGLNSPLGTLNPETAQVFFRNVRLLDVSGAKPEQPTEPPSVASNPGWRVFTSKKGGFRIEFPGAFELRQSTNEDGRQIVVVRAGEADPLIEATEDIYDQHDKAAAEFQARTEKLRKPKESSDSLLAIREITPFPGWRGVEADSKHTIDEKTASFERRRIIFDGKSRLIEMYVYQDKTLPETLADTLFKSFALIPIRDVTTAITSTGPSVPPKWEAYHAAKCGFDAEFPAAPTTEEIEGIGGAEELGEGIRVSAKLGATSFALGWTEYLGNATDVKMWASERFDRTRDYYRRMARIVKQNRSFTLGRWQGIETVTIDNFAEPPRVERQWALYDGSHNVEVTVAGPLSEDSPELADRFFRSFRIEGTGPVQYTEAAKEPKTASLREPERSPSGVNQPTPATPPRPEPASVFSKDGQENQQAATPSPAPQPRPVQSPASDQPPKGERLSSKSDPRVLKALNEAGLKFRQLDDGRYAIVVACQDGRTQQVFVPSVTYTLGPLEIREVWSSSTGSSKTLPSCDTLARLLRDSEHKKLGGWQMVHHPSGDFVVFCAQVPADSSPELLKAVIEMVATNADAMEKELTGKDGF